MSTEAEMTINELRKYRRKMQKRHLRAAIARIPSVNPARRLGVGVGVHPVVMSLSDIMPATDASRFRFGSWLRRS